MKNLTFPFRRIAILLVIAAAFVAAHLLRAQTRQLPTDGLWQNIEEQSLDRTAERVLVPERYRTVRLDRALLTQTLAVAPKEFTAPPEKRPIIHLPMPDGSVQRFRFEQSPVVEQGLGDKYPELLNTYRAQGIDDPSATARFDWLPSGFHAIVLSPAGTVLVDPYAKNNTQDYITYWKRDAANLKSAFRCDFVDQDAVIPNAPKTQAPDVSSGSQLRTYRLALACTNEYAVAVGNNTISGTLAAEVIVMNRVNGVYERDVALRMIMVANNHLVTYAGDNNNCGAAANEPCTAANDPYSNSSGSTMLSQNTTTLNNVIGLGNYDIGHVFSTGGGGVATLNGPCGTNKARGVTGLPNPVGDPFSIDYVAHEMGHQWGANHTFNGGSGSCSGSNRSGPSAYEPGSGITIMAYAGICGNQNLAANSIDTFHVKSIEVMVAFAHNGTGNTCAVTSSTNNAIPAVTGPGNFTIPKQTPFALTAAATDPDGDTITYDWQEYDLGPTTTAVPNTDADGNARPIFRPYLPTISGTRFFPSLPYILNNANVPPATTGVFLTGELLPAISRTMTFQVIARDNRSGAGALNTATSVVTIDGAATPFAVTAPNTGVSVPAMSNLNVTWAASGNAQNVKISLSVDGGLTFPHVLAASVPNSGAATVALPDSPTSLARIKVEAVGNIYFDISDTNFTITPSQAFALGTAVSRKTHGTGGGTFDVNLTGQGGSGIEPRLAGAGGAHTVIVTFNRTLASGNATVTSGTGTVSGAPVISGNAMTINLTSVADAQTLVITLQSVTDTSGQVLPDTNVNASFLAADVNGDALVNTGDTLQVRARSGQVTDSTNFRMDVNVDGIVNSGDGIVVRGRSGNFLP
jgi:hypothetical protein